MPAKKIIPTGTRFGNLTVVQVVNTGEPRTHYLCRCARGGQVISLGATLRNGDRTHCGCLTALSHSKHGLSAATEYRSWVSMIQRCHNPKAPNYSDYGGRGITVFPEWRDSFDAFYRFMGLKPTPQHSIDRFPNKTGNYEPGNVRWASPKEQALNRRDNVFFTLNGHTAPIAYWIVGRNIARVTLVSRRRAGWSDEKALMTPVRHRTPPAT